MLSGFQVGKGGFPNYRSSTTPVLPSIFAIKAALDPFTVFASIPRILKSLCSFSCCGCSIVSTRSCAPIVALSDWEAVKQLKQRGQSLLISESEKKTIRLYQQKLSQISKQLSREVSYQKGQPSLSKIFQPLFQFALTRSSAAGVSAVAENKALLFVLAMHAAGKNIDSIIGETVEQTNSSSKIRLKASLRMRHDLMQHFSISAFLSSVAGDALAHATGIFKEVSDSQGGSGFSFADLAADQAGVKFGTMAVTSESSAQSLQKAMSRIIGEDDYMPRINNLPEGLQEGRFKRQYGTTKDVRYKQMQKELDKRIRLCRLYKDN